MTAPDILNFGPAARSAWKIDDFGSACCQQQITGQSEWTHKCSGTGTGTGAMRIYFTPFQKTV